MNSQTSFPTSLPTSSPTSSSSRLPRVAHRLSPFAYAKRRRPPTFKKRYHIAENRSLDCQDQVSSVKLLFDGDGGDGGDNDNKSYTPQVPKESLDIVLAQIPKTLHPSSVETISLVSSRCRLLSDWCENHAESRLTIFFECHLKQLQLANHLLVPDGVVDDSILLENGMEKLMSSPDLFRQQKNDVQLLIKLYLKRLKLASDNRNRLYQSWWSVKLAHWVDYDRALRRLQDFMLECKSSADVNKSACYASAAGGRFAAKYRQLKKSFHFCLALKLERHLAQKHIESLCISWSGFDNDVVVSAQQ